MVVVDTNVLVDYLRGIDAARRVVEPRAASDDLAASEVTRIELLAGMRAGEEEIVARLERALVWVPVTDEGSRRAGQLAQTWRRSHGGIDPAAYAVAATARVLNAELWTKNVRHFPMFPDLEPPY